MKLKTILVAALFALGVTAAVAIAKPPPGTGKSAAVAKLEAKKAKLAAKAAKVRANEMNRCRGGHMQLRGDLVSTNLGSSELKLLVKQANKKGRSLVGTEATVVVGDKTKMRRYGKSSLDKLEAGDRLKVLVRMCRDAEGDAALYAKQVVAVRAKAEDDEDDTTSTSTSTETETTSSTETETTTSTETETTP